MGKKQGKKLRQDPPEKKKLRDENKELDAREQRFVDEYLVDLDVERAAEAAGYARSVALSKAYQWVSKSKENPKPHVRAAIEKGKAERSERTKIDQDWVLKRLAALADSQLRNVISWKDGYKHLKNSDELSWEDSYAISEIKIKERNVQITTDTSSEGVETMERRSVIEFEIKQCSKEKSLIAIGKHLDMFNGLPKGGNGDGRDLVDELLGDVLNDETSLSDTETD